MKCRIVATLVCATLDLATIAHAQEPAFATKLVGPVAFTDEPGQERLLEERMKTLGIPQIAVAVVDNHELVVTELYGAESREGAPCSLRFQVGSLSKPVTAALTLSLAEDGVLDIDASASDYLRTWQFVGDEGFTRPSVAQLLSHSGGISAHGFRGYASGEPVPTLAQVLAGHAPANSPAIRQDMAAGQSLRYSGGGYVVLQQMLEDLSGLSFADLAQEQLFSRAGMNDSTFALDGPEVPSTCLAEGVDRTGTPIPGGYHRFRESAAAGLWTTAPDMARFMLWLMGDDGNSIARRMLTPQNDSDGNPLGTPNGNSPGLGLILDGAGGDQRFSHSGSNPGFKAIMVGFPELGKGAVIIANSDMAPPVMQELLRAIAAQYDWPERFHERIEPLASQPDISEFAGIYKFTSQSGRELTIEVQDHAGRFIDPGTGRVFLFPEPGVLRIPSLDVEAILQ